MSRETGHRYSHAGRRVTRKMLVLSRKVANLLHPSGSMAVVTKRTGQRFSLISRADYQATLAPHSVPASQRESEVSVQLVGFHVVCGFCDGFVVRNGVIRNCAHQRDSSSSMSDECRERGQGAVRSRTSVSSRSPRRAPTAADDISNLVLRTSDAARKSHFRRTDETRVSLCLDEDTVTETDNSVGSDRNDQPRCNPETLMQDWREWSERWERRVKSR